MTDPCPECGHRGDWHDERGCLARYPVKRDRGWIEEGSEVDYAMGLAEWVRARRCTCRNPLTNSEIGG